MECLFEDNDENGEEIGQLLSKHSDSLLCCCE